MPRRTTALLASLAVVLSLGATPTSEAADPLPAVGAASAITASVTAGLAPARARAKAARIRAKKAEAAAKAERKRLAAERRNPLFGHPMGVYQGNGDQAWAPYARSRGENRRLLAKIALRPKAKWFGDWIGNGAIQGKVRDYVANSTRGRRNTLVQMTVFRMQPWEHEACRRLPSGREQASYRDWIDRFAAGIGDAHVALILQPDGPFALCVPGRSPIPSQLIAYSARTFSALPHTSVYIDGGAADWPAGSASEAVDFLLADGVRYARGIALDSTHYTATGDDIDRGTAIIDGLARRGVRGKHLVINTSSNGRPFTFNRARGNDPDNAGVCRSRGDRGCVTLGIPPTVDVANARWGLSGRQRVLARRYVDAYLWFGRPWLYRQNDPFDMGRALQLARTTPY